MILLLTGISRLAILVARIGRVLLAALFLAVLAGPATADFRIESLDNDFPAEVASAVSEGKLLVIMFHQIGCPYCDKMRVRVFPDPKVIAYYSKHFVMIESNIRGNLDVVAMDGETTTETKMARKLRVRATPVFLFLDKDGKEALRLTGFLDADLFVRAGRYVVDGVYRTDQSFYRYLKEAQ